MKIAYWIVAGLLALLYFYGGWVKAVQSKEQLEPRMEWVATVPMWQVRLIGGIEIIGALGLMIPPLTGIAPFLAVVAASGLVVLQLLALRLHLSQGGARDTGVNVVLIVLAGTASWLATAF